MWSYRLALLSLLTLVSCGFTPAYGPGSTGAQLRGQIAFGEPSDETTYILVRRLEERLGIAGDPAFDLSVVLDTREEGLAIDADGDIERYSLLGTARYTLTDSGTDEERATGEVSNFTSYSATGTTVATLAAQRDAQERLITILADMLVTHLIAQPL